MGKQLAISWILFHLQTSFYVPRYNLIFYLNMMQTHLTLLVKLHFIQDTEHRKSEKYKKQTDYLIIPCIFSHIPCEQLNKRVSKL